MQPLAEIEKELLNGQSAQGPLTAEEVYLMMEKTGLHEKYVITVDRQEREGTVSNLIQSIVDSLCSLLFTRSAREIWHPSLLSIVSATIPNTWNCKLL